MAQIGEPQRFIIAEPIMEPVPQREVPENEPQRVPQEPEKVPAE